MAIKKLCIQSGCNEFTEENTSFCKKHLEEYLQHRKETAFKTAKRTNTHLYNTTEWRTLRKQKLSINPICEICSSQFNLEIHHIKAPKGNIHLFFNINNLQTLCKTCHQHQTQKETRKSI